NVCTVAASTSGTWTSRATANPKAPALDGADGDPGRHRRAVATHLPATGHHLERALEARRVPGGEQLLGVGRPARATHLDGRPQVDIDQPVRAADVPFT